MAPSIGTMTIADYDEVVAFWQRQPGIGLNESDARPAVAAFLDRNPDMSLVARHGGRVIAAVLCGHDGRRGYLHHLAVDPEHRRHGLGRQLVERCLATLQAQGIPKCSIFLYADNEPGQAFWRRIGYAPRPDLLLLQRNTDGSPLVASRRAPSR